MRAHQVLHPNLNNYFLADVAWTFSLYIEAVAVLPQLHMFQKKGGEIEPFTSHWVFSIGAARLLDFVRVSSVASIPDLTLLLLWHHTGVFCLALCAGLLAVVLP